MSNKISFFSGIVNIDIFRCSAIILSAPTVHDVIKGLPTFFKSLKIPIKAKDIKTWSSLIRETIEGDPSKSAAQAYTITEGTDVFIIFIAKDFSDISEELIVHETHHAASFILDEHLVDDEETEAYTQEYLYNKIRCMQDDYIDNKKNSNKSLKKK